MTTLAILSAKGVLTVKKIMRNTVAILIIIACLLSLVSCFSPAKDIDEAVENLRKNEYSVDIKDNPGVGMKRIITASKTGFDKTHYLFY
jgi:hypothetical protein